MASPTGDDLDGVSESATYSDGTVVRVFCMRTDRNAYPSGWAYKLHYGTTEPDPPDTLDDGTIRRYDNSHEDTKGHELHAAPEPRPKTVEFPGMVELWERFWSEIPKTEFEVE
ncbi:hypothetical protein HZS55_05820 [Halosimplex rubrum]|uniref:Uncharacterized protein n=1 Tax=Halosimplex rubrum TaxID=869889 RepID=A0A7D5SWU8_9EURY|nr:DUF6516 family protein [Halosimplex rubrum]QLH76851.1 hypothetical protein HZS55_05820 [Halosimplex rubrum]